MATVEVKRRDGSVEVVEGADACQPDGPFTTFFAVEEGRSAVDCWSVRMASIRSNEIVAMCRRDEPAGRFRCYDRARANAIVLDGWALLRFTSRSTDAEIVGSVTAALGESGRFGAA